MKRLHVHVCVDDLAKSMESLSTHFGDKPTRVESDYAKCIFEDPRKLVASLERNSHNPGIELLVLPTEAAEASFLAMGHEVIDRRYVPEAVKQSTGFRSLCPASAVCMTKSGSAQLPE
jgi:hypothetical protein